jgi:hypothetical protein
MPMLAIRDGGTMSGSGFARAGFSLPALSVAAATTAMVILTTQLSTQLLDYGVGLVPAAIPWLAAVLSVVAAAVGAWHRGSTSAAGALVLGALAVVTAWAVAMLPFDALRVVGLIPLPLSAWGLVMRLLLLVAATTAAIPVLRSRRARQARCIACDRVLPGRLDRLPRWPARVAVVFALPYPVLRVVWALGGTFGTSGDPLEMDAAVAWGAAIVGWVLVAFTVLLLIGRGPLWARALFGLGGLIAGAALTTVGGLAAFGTLTLLATQGIDSSQGSAGLSTWVFELVYGSWFIAGLGVLVGSWRYWAHRRDECPECALSQ